MRSLSQKSCYRGRPLRRSREPTVGSSSALVGDPRTVTPERSRARAEATGALAAKGAGMPAPRAVDRGAEDGTIPCSRAELERLRGVGSLHSERGAGHRVRAI